MKILIAAIGKFKKSPEQEISLEYIKRLAWKVECKEFEVRQENTEKRKAKEAEILLAACAGYDAIIALDERGKNLSSLEFAAQIKNWQNTGKSSLAFIIGGADGLDASVALRADLLLSFGRLTWPHLLVRAMLAEQIYRAQTLISGHPYHRE